MMCTENFLKDNENNQNQDLTMLEQYLVTYPVDPW